MRLQIVPATYCVFLIESKWNFNWKQIENENKKATLAEFPEMLPNYLSQFGNKKLSTLGRVRPQRLSGSVALCCNSYWLDRCEVYCEVIALVTEHVILWYNLSLHFEGRGNKIGVHMLCGICVTVILHSEYEYSLSIDWWMTKTFWLSISAFFN